MRKPIIKKQISIGAMILIAITIFGITCVNEPRGDEQAYPTNKYGETYGAVIYDSSEEPELVAVTATNGQEGYIKNSDVNKYAGGNVNSPRRGY